MSLFLIKLRYDKNVRNNVSHVKSFLLQLEHFPPKLQKYVKIFVLVLKRCEFVLLIYSLLWKQNSGYTVTVFICFQYL